MVVEGLGYVILTLKVHQEDGQYVSECVELGVASFGETIGEAFEAIKDATSLHLETLADEGELGRVLAERGVAVNPGRPPEDGRELQVTARPKEYVSVETVSLPLSA